MKGIVTHKIGGKKRTLSFGLNTLIESSEELGIEVQELEGNLGNLKNLRTFLYHALYFGEVWRAKQNGKDPDLDFDETDAGFWATELIYEGDFQEFMKKYQNSMPKKGDLKDKGKKKGKKK